MWTACGDSIARAYDAKSGTLKRSFVGHEAAVNCLVINEGKLYTGSSDGTLRLGATSKIVEVLGGGGRGSNNFRSKNYHFLVCFHSIQKPSKRVKTQ